jgi:hypothetical protein
MSVPTLDQILARFDEQASRSKSLTDDERQLLDRAIDDTINAIACHSNWRAAERDLIALGQIHKVLATLCFKYGQPLSERQRRIVREYDRWDVADVRQTIYDAIKKCQFP